jgi:hypothetical protein
MNTNLAPISGGQLPLMARIETGLDLSASIRDIRGKMT